QYRVIGTARHLHRLQALSEQLGESFHALELDVTNAQMVESILKQLPANWAEIDVLVNNAGHDVGGRRSFEAGSADGWCDIIETNVQGMIRVTHELVKGMLERCRGHIVNMGSIAGLKPYATGSAYVASKYAVHGLSETLRLDYAGKGIRVTEIMPGLVKTGFAEQRLGNAEKAAEFYDSFEQSLNPEDIAETVLFALQQPKHVEIAQLVVLPVS
ncbi:MAG: SDR family NAD(P)-dependent oxidoreductase, partial [Gammaproteobacteria bacterium]|nr:SDR family NAD(P)-dependent oxidoreductase [Gammaproteobacteria bacterium]